MNRVVFTLAFSLKGEALSALSCFESSNPRRSSYLTLIWPHWGGWGFTRWTVLSPSRRSHPRERRSLQTVLPSLKTSSPRRNSQLTSSLLYEVKGGFNWWTVLPSPGVLYELSFPPLRFLTQAEKFITDLVLTPPGQTRILTGEPYFLPLVFSLKGGGVLYESSCPSLRLLTHGERFIIVIIFAQRQGRILLANHTVQPWCFHSRMGGGVLSNLPSPFLRLLTQANGL